MWTEGEGLDRKKRGGTTKTRGGEFMGRGDTEQRVTRVRRREQTKNRPKKTEKLTS